MKGLHLMEVIFLDSVTWYNTLSGPLHFAINSRCSSLARLRDRRGKWTTPILSAQTKLGRQSHWETSHSFRNTALVMTSPPASSPRTNVGYRGEATMPHLVTSTSLSPMESEEKQP
jgi:hypothetical protein